MARFGVFVSLLTLLALPIHAQTVPVSDPQALSIAAKSIAALTGGTAISDISFSGTVMSLAGPDNQTGTGIFLAKGFDKSRIELTLANGKRSEIRNANSGVPVGLWASRSASSNIAQQNCWTDASWFAPALSSLSALNLNVILSFLGQQTRDGVSVLHLRSYRFVPNPEITVTTLLQRASTMDFYLDSGSFLPLAIAFNTHPDDDLNTDIGIEIRFADYRAVGGVNAPFHVQRLINGSLELDVAVSNVVINSGLAESDFISEKRGHFMVRTFVPVVVFLFVSLIGASLCLGQVQSGTPPFASFGGGPFDVVNLGNLNVHFSVPILHKNGRGVPFVYDLGYDSSVWSPVSSSGTVSWQPVFNWGWEASYVANTGYVTYKRTLNTCHNADGETGSTSMANNYVYHDVNGTNHPFAGMTILVTGTACGGSSQLTLTSLATDGSGLTLNITGNGATSMITTAGGSVVIPGLNLANGSTTAPVVASDSNGNQVTANSSGVFTDTLNTSVLTVAGTAPSPITMKYTAPSGALATFSVNYTPFNVKTNFGCAGVTEYNVSSVPLVSSISLPDGMQYAFTYEATPGSPSFVTGRLKSVTLPTGGTITYSYSGGSNGIICADGSTAGLTRTLNPGGAWAYSRSQVSGSHWTTTVSDPSPTPNQTVVDFQKDSATTNSTNGFYETQRRSYQGSSGGTVLKTMFACYNGNSIATPSACLTTNVITPIARTTVFTYLPDTSAQRAEIDTTYNTFGLVTRVDEYDLGTSSATRTTLTTYNTALTNGIVDRPASVTTKDGAGVTKASTSYGYDETTVTATSGTPQHVAISGSRGNMTSTVIQTNGTVNLYRKFSYYDTGTPNTSTDLSTSSTTNGATTTYNYATGAASCGNSFITSINEPLSLSRSMTWDCNGGVALSVTDENGKSTGASYTDSYFWRPATSTDQAGNVTSFSYLSATRTESAMVFNSGASTVDHAVQLDGFGRTIVNQTRQAPTASSYDSVETDYNNVGQVSNVTLPYSGGIGSLCSGTCPGTTTSYDALGRVLSSTDAGTRSITNTYTQNDVLQTLGPAPSGENTKRKQSEYDGLGRLTSVCEITSGTTAFPGGTCGQTSAQTGYWTKYTYDILNNLTAVTQNAQAGSGQQNRAFVYDMLGRLTSETNPESGTTSYIYDADGTCGSTSAGDMVRRVGASSTTSCYYHDAIHRTTAINYPTGCSRFMYDAATVNGVVMQNAKGRLAETSTDSCAPPFNVTEEGFSYSSRGEVAAVYESTPHSGGYYTLNSTYWPNGALNTLSGIGLPTITYGSDGEGRPSTVSGSSGQNPVTATSYNVSRQVTGITLGSGDTVTNGFDANTGRQTSYAEAINGSTISGALTWNPNGTLNHLVVTDPFNASDVQTCNYTHDDLVRIASANCGTPWSQTFTYDPFGNLTKSGSITWNPGYNTATNRYTLGGTTYDATGNLLNDTFHIYTWHVDGRPLTLDAISLTHDAQGRIVEKNSGGVFTEYVYDAGGNKIAIMSGQTLVKGLVPLPGGIQATYDPSNSGYRIPDWLGTVRFASNSNRTYSSSEAFAPFGERYSTGGSAPSNYTFTGMINSTASDEYDFPFRSLQTSQGRWISPDPAGLAAVNPANPQSWNRYAYVLNNPLGLLDPLGLDCSDGTSGGPNTGPVDCPDIPDNSGPTFQSTAWAPADDNDMGWTFYTHSFMPHTPNWRRFRLAANNGTGFTLGIRAPGQTYSQCLAANSSTYSINNWLPSSAQNGATKFALGNDVSNALFGDANEGTAGLVVGAGVAAAPLGVGTAGTFGRRTASIFNLNLSGTTGPAPTILGKTGAAEVVGWVSGAFELKLAADIGATAAEALNCIGRR